MNDQNDENLSILKINSTISASFDKGRYFSSTAASIASSDYENVSRPQIRVNNNLPVQKVVSPGNLEWPAIPLSRSSSVSQLSIRDAKDAEVADSESLSITSKHDYNIPITAQADLHSDVDTDYEDSEFVSVSSNFDGSQEPKVRKSGSSSNNSVKRVKSFNQSDCSVRTNNATINSNYPIINNRIMKNMNVSSLSVSSNTNTNTNTNTNVNKNYTRLSYSLPNEPPISLNEKINLLRVNNSTKKAHPILSPVAKADTFSSHSQSNSLSNISAMVNSNNAPNIIYDEQQVQPLKGKRPESILQFGNQNFPRLSHMTSLSTVGMSDIDDDDQSVLSGYRY